MSAPLPHSARSLALLSQGALCRSTRWDGSVAKVLGPTAAADRAHTPPRASSRRRRIRPRDAAIVLCTVLLIGCGASTFIWWEQVTRLVAAYALSAATAVMLAWVSA